MRSSLTSCRWSWLWLDDGGDVASSLHPSSPGCGSSGCSCCHRSLVSGRPCRQGSTHSHWHDQVGNKKELNPDGQDDRRVDRQGFRLFLSLILSFFFFLSIHVSFLSHFLLPFLPSFHPNFPTSTSAHPCISSLPVLPIWLPSSLRSFLL